MKTRIVMAGIISSIFLASCQWGGEADTTGRIHFSFAEPLYSTLTRADAVPDTNSFILKVTNNSGEVIYEGAYGARPSEMSVKAGTYEIEVYSCSFDTPAFDMPQWGDSKVIVVSNGEDVTVSFLCKMVNSGVIIHYSDYFKEKYGSGKIVLSQDEGSLEYGFYESRTAYFKAGNVAFSYIEADLATSLFNRVLGEGEIRSITLDASKDESESSFSIQVDTTVNRIWEKIMIGEGHYGENGLSAETAYSVSSARNHSGDTVWVWGYVVGGDLTSSSISFTAPFTKTSNIAIAETAGENIRDNCFSVELSKAAVKSALNLVDNPGYLGRKVFLKGAVSTYYGLTGLKSVSEYKIE